MAREEILGISYLAVRSCRGFWQTRVFGVIGAALVGFIGRTIRRNILVVGRRVAQCVFVTQIMRYFLETVNDGQAPAADTESLH